MEDISGLLQEKARRLHVIILIILWILCSRNTEAAVPSTVLVSFSLYNSGDDGKLRMSFFFCEISQNTRPLDA